MQRTVVGDQFPVKRGPPVTHSAAIARAEPTEPLRAARPGRSRTCGACKVWRAQGPRTTKTGQLIRRSRNLAVTDRGISLRISADRRKSPPGASVCGWSFTSRVSRETGALGRESCCRGRTRRCNRSQPTSGGPGDASTAHTVLGHISANYFYWRFTGNAKNGRRPHRRSVWPLGAI